MRAIQSKIPRGLCTGSKLTCSDNTGARKVQIVSVDRFHGVRRRQPKMGLGDMGTVSVKKGTPEMRRKLEKAVIIRQVCEIRRVNGLRLTFDDNAMVITNERGEPKGTEIKGPVAREVAERYPKIGSMATIIV